MCSSSRSWLQSFFRQVTHLITTTPSYWPFASPVLSNWTGKTCRSWEATMALDSLRRRTNGGRCCTSISKRLPRRQAFSAVMPLETTWSGRMENRHSNSLLLACGTGAACRIWAVAHSVRQLRSDQASLRKCRLLFTDSLLLRRKTHYAVVLPQGFERLFNFRRLLARDSKLNRI